MSKLSKKLHRGEFVITCELSPPKGTDLSVLLDKAAGLSDYITAFNLTDSAAARMTMSPSVAGYKLLQAGGEPIVQFTSRDQNRLALQSGMLGAAVLGIENIVVMGGDPPKIGDHPEAVGVNDLFSSQIIAAAQALRGGHDLAGNELKGKPDFFIGSVCNPGAAKLADEIDNTKRKIEAGAQFFQTQAIYEVDALIKFLDKLNAPNIPILCGVIPIKSVTMAKYMNARVPGINIPDKLISRIGDAEKNDAVVATSLEIAAQVIGDVRAHCQGLHIMAIGWEKHIAGLLKNI